MSTQPPTKMAQIYVYRIGVLETLGSLLVLENVVGVVFNVVVLIIHLLRKKDHSCANAAFLVNLTIVDLLVCFMTIPMTTVNVFAGLELSPLVCVFHEASVSMATTATALGLLIISIDRYQIIVTPFSGRLIRSHKPLVLGVMWAFVFVGFLFPIIALWPSSPHQSVVASGMNVLNGNLSNPRMSCFLWVRLNNARMFYEIYYLVIYVIANGGIILCYAYIFIAAKRRVNTRVSFIRSSLTRAQVLPKELGPQKVYEHAITKMTLIVVITFVLCWTPHVVSSVVMVTCELAYMEMVHVVCLAFAYTGTLLHPLVYAFMQKNFRNVFNKKVIQRRDFHSNRENTTPCLKAIETDNDQTQELRLSDSSTTSSSSSYGCLCCVRKGSADGFSSN